MATWDDALTNVTKDDFESATTRNDAHPDQYKIFSELTWAADGSSYSAGTTTIYSDGIKGSKCVRYYARAIGSNMSHPRAATINNTTELERLGNKIYMGVGVKIVSYYDGSSNSVNHSQFGFYDDTNSIFLSILPWSNNRFVLIITIDGSTTYYGINDLDGNFTYTFNNSEWYWFEIVVDTISEEVSVYVYDSTDELVYRRLDLEVLGIADAVIDKALLHFKRQSSTTKPALDMYCDYYTFGYTAIFVDKMFLVMI